jgi:hypothetical protein
MSNPEANARDEAIDRVVDANKKWIQECTVAVYRMRLGAEPDARFAGEDIRRVLGTVVGQPTHHNAWGGLINGLKRKKLIKPTGKFRHMKMPGSHARLTPEYKWGKL